MFVEKFRAIRAQSAANRKIPVYRSTVPRIKGNQNAVLAVTFAALLLGVVNISAVHAGSAAAHSQVVTAKPCRAHACPQRHMCLWRASPKICRKTADLRL